MEASPANTTTTHRRGNLRGAARIFGGPTRVGIGLAAAATCGVLAATIDSAYDAASVSRWLFPGAFIALVSMFFIIAAYRNMGPARPDKGGHLLAMRMLFINGWLTVGLIIISTATPAHAGRIVGAAAISTSTLMVYGFFAALYAFTVTMCNAAARGTAAAVPGDTGR